MTAGRGFPPSTGGVRRSVLWARRGMPPDRWFALGGRVRDSGHYRMMTKLLMLEANLLGVRAVSPTYLPYNDFSPVAHWIAGQRAGNRQPWGSVPPEINRFET